MPRPIILKIKEYRIFFSNLTTNYIGDRPTSQPTKCLIESHSMWVKTYQINTFNQLNFSLGGEWWGAGGGNAICTILNLKGDPDILNQGYFRSIEKWCYLIYLSKTISKSIYLRICSTFVVIFFCIFRMSPMRMREYSPWIK